VGIYLQPLTLNLVMEHKELIAAIKEQVAEERAAAIVLDTLNRSLQGSESSDEDMSNYVKANDALREAFGCAVIVVHHCGHEAQRPRGHSSLIGEADAVIKVLPSGNHVLTEVEMMMDGERGTQFLSRLEVVDVGTNGAIRRSFIRPPPGGH
jgi:RecA-family ATPase